MVGRLAKYFKGGLSIPDMMKMNFKEVHFWYKIYERQIAEEIIIGEFSRKSNPIPSGKPMERLINKKIAEWHNTEV